MAWGAEVLEGIQCHVFPSAAHDLTVGHDVNLVGQKIGKKYTYTVVVFNSRVTR